MKNESPHQHLLVEGIAAARAGDQEEAQKLLRRVTELEPDNADAWIWRASVVDNSADKKSFLEEALRLEPENLEAKLALKRITELEGNISARVENEEEAQEIYDNDPLRKALHITQEIHPFGHRTEALKNKLESME